MNLNLPNFESRLCPEFIVVTLDKPFLFHLSFPVVVWGEVLTLQSSFYALKNIHRSEGLCALTKSAVQILILSSTTMFLTCLSG